MWEQFWVQNIHYVIEVFIGFLMVTAGWIYLDGWLVEKRAKTLFRTIGFFALAIWSFLGATPLGIIGIETFEEAEKIVDIAGLIGFGLLLLSLFMDPIPVRPGGKPVWLLSKLWKQNIAKSLITIPFVGGFFKDAKDVLGDVFIFILPAIGFIIAALASLKIWMFLFSGIVAILLYLHYKRGIQSEWKNFYLGFLFLTIALLFSVFSLWQNTQNVFLSQILARYHVVWMAEHAVKFIGAIFLGLWAWGFIRFRIFPQIFSSFIAFSFVIFVSTTIIYTGFLLNRTQDDIFQSLEINVKTMQFALEKVKESAILAARIASTNPQIKESMRTGNKDVLFTNMNALMFENETDFMAAVNTGGEVLMRAEDKERFGDSIANDPVVWRALDGKAVVTIAVTQGVTVPTVSIRASSPVIDTLGTGEPEIIGVIITGFLLDTAFVDGIKRITGLDLTIFANDISAATTFQVPESEIRLLGTRETNQDIIKAVLKESGTFTGSTMVLNRPFLGAYIPIKDLEETTIGMFFTGRSQASIMNLVSDTLRLTFSISILLMILSIIPIAWLSRFISYHQQV